MGGIEVIEPRRELRFWRMLSRSYNPGLSVSSPTLRRIAWSSSPRRYLATTALPDVGAISAASIRTVVVLPAPFDPRKPSTAPRGAVSVRRSTAIRSPKAQVESQVSIAYMGKEQTARSQADCATRSHLLPLQHSLQITPQTAPIVGMAQFAQRARFDLPDAFARDAEFASHLF